tara:strand:+ start:2924 stop:3130 length:207 start_codon:yes stop_codon:yes gene_type:complete
MNSFIKKPKNILITGGAGYIESHIVEELVKTKSNIIILDNLATGYKRLIKIININKIIKSVIKWEKLC